MPVVSHEVHALFAEPYFRANIAGSISPAQVEFIKNLKMVGNTENLGLEGTGVKVDRTHVVIDQWCRTGEPGVYAIGDLAGPPWLAHKAMHEGVVCVEKIAEFPGVHPVDFGNVPGCTYCRPQVASVVMTDAQGATRRVITNAFGYYTFNDVTAGGSYIMGVESRRFRYSTRVVQVTDTLADVDFTPVE